VSKLPQDFRALVQRIDASGSIELARQLHDHVGVVRYAPPELVLKPLRPFGSEWSRTLAGALKSATGAAWQLSLADQPAEPSLREQEKLAEERVKAEVLSDPNVRSVLDAIPGAELETFSVMKGA
jgi:DNA polymerase-3 subunit gamma/tau